MLKSRSPNYTLRQSTRELDKAVNVIGERARKKATAFQLFLADPAHKLPTKKPAEGEEEVEEGALCDVAPTILDIMVCVAISMTMIIADDDLCKFVGSSQA